jgi:hypothetical protein
MRTFITTVVAVITLSAVVACPTHAQVGKTLPPGAKVQKTRSPTTGSLTAGRLALGLQVTQFTGARALNRDGLISVRAMVTNTSREGLSNMTYSLSRKNSTGGWTSVEILTRISPRGETDPPSELVSSSTAIVEAEAGVSEDAVTFKLDVSGRTQGGFVHRASRQLRLPAKRLVRVVSYSTSGWLWVGTFSSGFATSEYRAITQRAQMLQNKMQATYGFETKRVIRTNTGAFGIGGSNTIRVYVRGSRLTRSFGLDEQTAVKVFQDALSRDDPGRGPPVGPTVRPAEVTAGRRGTPPGSCSSAGARPGRPGRGR